MIAEHVAAVVAPLAARLAVLELRMLPVADRAWVPGKTYQQGDFAQDCGALWVAKSPTRERPGDGCVAWQYAGRDDG